VARISFGKLLARVVPALAGVAVLVAVASFAGVADVGKRLGSALAWLPFLLLLEGARVPIEGIVTRRLLGLRAARVPFVLLARVQLVFYAVSVCSPGGRVLGEASKIALLGGRVGAPAASAVATASQAASLVSDALVVLVGAGAIYELTGFGELTALALLFVAACVLLAAVVVAATRASRTPRVLERFPKLAQFLERWRRAARAQRLFAGDVIGLLFVARVAQVLLLGTALAAVGGGWSALRAWALLAVVLAGAAVGEAIPAQLGATDAALVAAAPALGIDRAQAVTIGVLFHVVQLFWSVIGAIAGAALRDGPGEPAGAGGSEEPTN
jgi:Lysylphosphatidylglycerol synthase TM region